MGLANITLRKGRQAQKSVEKEDILDEYASAGLKILFLNLGVGSGYVQSVETY